MGATGFCILFLLLIAAASIAVTVLQVYLVVKIVQWIWRFFKHGELPWRKKPQPAEAGGQAPGLEAAFAKARAETAQKQAALAAAARPEARSAPGGLTAAARAEEEVRMAEALLKRKREELAAAMKEQGRLDKLALVYYVEASLRDGCAAEAVAQALKAKGWPEADITAAFQACGAA